MTGSAARGPSTGPRLPCGTGWRNHRGREGTGRLPPVVGFRAVVFGPTLQAMTQLEMELAALRRRRRSFGTMAWIRSHRPFDRRAIREPDERDAYWAVVQERLAASDARLTRNNAYVPGVATASTALVVLPEEA